MPLKGRIRKYLKSFFVITIVIFDYQNTLNTRIKIYPNSDMKIVQTIFIKLFLRSFRHTFDLTLSYIWEKKMNMSCFAYRPLAQSENSQFNYGFLIPVFLFSCLWLSYTWSGGLKKETKDRMVRNSWKNKQKKKWRENNSLCLIHIYTF